MYRCAETTDIEVWKRASSGGTIRTIANELLIKKLVTKVIMTRSRGCDTETLVVDTVSEILPATWYSYNESLVPTALSQFSASEHLMIVALPCQARTIREVAPNVLIISPVCFQTLNPVDIRRVLRRLGIDVEKVESVQRVHDDVLVNLQDVVRIVPFRVFWNHFKYNQHSNHFCRSCKDHFGSAADISVFDNRHRSNIICVRTSRGALVLEQVRAALKLKRSVSGIVTILWKLVTHKALHLASGLSVIVRNDRRLA